TLAVFVSGCGSSMRPPAIPDAAIGATNDDRRIHDIAVELSTKNDPFVSVFLAPRLAAMADAMASRLGQVQPDGSYGIENPAPDMATAFNFGKYSTLGEPGPDAITIKVARISGRAPDGNPLILGTTGVFHFSKVAFCEMVLDAAKRADYEKRWNDRDQFWE